MKYDLEERTAQLGINIIQFCKKIHTGVITSPLINQLVRAGTSIGANYAEADDAQTSKDFNYKICTCKEESRETMHFLRRIAAAVPEMDKEATMLWQEAKELNLIFNAIHNKMKLKSTDKKKS